MSYVLAASRKGYADMPGRLQEATGRDFLFIDNPGGLTLDVLRDLDPEMLFFPHWSHMIPREIHETWECVVFHMTDLPFGRGGSPLQNLISRGIRSTQLSALRCTAELDAGPIYLKEPLDLSGTAEQIYARGAGLVEKMILRIIAERPEPLPQQGEPVYFKRRTPEQSDLKGLADPRRIFDHIRMLDAEGYPHAFLEVGSLRLEFTDAQLNDDAVEARVRIVPSTENGEEGS
jgi:methionyl-tRNA formyltransferase